MTERPRGLEASSYTDHDVFAAEVEAIFARSWTMVGHRSQVSSPGQILTATVGVDPVIVANDNGSIRAFYNVCGHRGHELIPESTPGGDLTTITGSLTCPYHAWTYNLDGSLLNARGEDVGEVCIPPVRVEELAGFLFVNLDNEASAVSEWIPGVEERLLAIAPKTPDRVFSHRRTHRIRANWKVAVENYNECYHCPNVHKTFSAGVVSPASYRITPTGNTMHHTAEGPPPEKAGYTRNDDGNDYGSFFTWPVSAIQCYPGQVINTFRWVPLAVDETMLIREWWFDQPEPSDSQQALIELDWETTVAEDFEIMDSVQRGLASRGYRPGPLITDPSGVATIHSEDTVPHLHRLWRAALADSL